MANKVKCNSRATLKPLLMMVACILCDGLAHSLILEIVMHLLAPWLLLYACTCRI